MLVSQFVSHVRRAGQLPTTVTSQLTDADILSHADMEIQSVLLPEVRQVQSDYLVSRADVVADTDGFAALPKRAATGGVRLVQILINGVAVPLPRMDPAADGGTGVAGPGTPAGYYFDGGGIRLVPQLSSGTLRIHYYVTPPLLVLDTDATLIGRVTSVTDNGTTWGCALKDNGITSLSLIVDMIGGSGTLNDVYGEDVTVAYTVASWSSIEVPKTAIRHPPRINDWVMTRVSNTSSQYFPKTPVLPLPEEMSPVVVLRTAARILESLGYLQEAQQKWQSADTALASARRLLAPRSDGNPKVLRGGLRQALSGPWWPGYDWRW